MSDGLTPPFEEPQGSSLDDGDEAVDGAAEISLYDLANWVDEGDVLVGFTGMLKIIREDGGISAVHVGMGVNEFEAIGLHRKILRDIEESMDMDSFWEEG